MNTCGQYARSKQLTNRKPLYKVESIPTLK